MGLGDLRRGSVVSVMTLAVLLAGCGGSGPGRSGPIAVVAGENFWGSIAAQLGGSKATVQSVVTDPNADPHEYASSADDARAFAEAGLVILNGAGYDDWGKRLLDANPAGGRLVLNVADLLGKKVGDNPHFWYNPDYVMQVADKITFEYKAIDPADAAYFDSSRAAWATALGPYLAEISTIKTRFAAAPVGSTESIFVYMAAALGLELTTPVEFMDAVAQGNDPPAYAVITFQNQISANRIKVLVYNVQTTTLVTTNLRTSAAAHHIPTVGVSESLQPLQLTFQDWQLTQLKGLEAALASNP
jgi:zinc/manganese transport system substrate-binding protein